MTDLAISPAEQKAHGKEVGEILVRDYGKKKYYSCAHIKKASIEAKNGFDWHSWAMSLFASPSGFASYHDSIGEDFNYSEMKAEMTAAMTNGASKKWFESSMSWLDWPNVDLPTVFDFHD
ncbi:hypothetical protein [uncultured Cocleimonas sp.]|uniref:hypothetical protein n=1 Tax=uncultured Cocleimonas sp. TaxID=1051587 RepID=UPI002622D9CA|nr:hypothetical protein [uncultured Cocleimonas sp.]